MLVDLSNFQTIFIDEIEWDSDNVYLITPLNGELPNPLPPHKCKIIWLCIERPSHYNTWKFDRHDIDEIWCCDRNWSERVGARFWTMGSHSKLGYFEPKKEFDFISNTYDPPRRGVIWTQLNDLKIAPRSFQRPDLNYAASKICVVPQQDDPPHAVTPLRFAIAAAYYMPMIYEAETNMEPFVNGLHFWHVKYDEIAVKTRQLLTEPKLRFDLGANLHKLLCVDTNFRRSVMAMFK